MPPRTRLDVYQIDASATPDGQAIVASGGSAVFGVIDRVTSINGASGAVDFVGSGVTITASGSSIVIEGQASTGGLPAPASGAGRYLLNSFAGVVGWEDYLGLDVQSASAASATFAPIDHIHDDRYLPEASADVRYMPASAAFLSVEASATFASAIHDHDGRYLFTEASATFASAAHTHPLSDIEQSGALDGDAIVWVGTEWVPSPMSAGAPHIHDDRYLPMASADVRYMWATASADFAGSGHLHDDRYLQIAASGDFALVDHDHNGVYLTVEASATFASAVHDHDDRYFTETESDARFAAIVHNHDGRYLFTEASATFASAIHDHDDRYYTELESDSLFASITHDHDGVYLFVEASATFASAVHVHDDRYFTEAESDARYASITHNHDGRYLFTEASATFASAVHVHDDRYYTETESDARYAAIVHNHDGRYLFVEASATFASAVHNHDDRYFTETESDARFAAIAHNHDGRYLFVEASATFASAVHTHDDRYFTETESDARFAAIVHNHDGRYLFTEASATFASAIHVHDDRYFTEAESDARFASITHNHDGRYLFVEASATFASAVHNHDDRYFTEAESDARFAAIVHNHDGRYLFAEASATFASAVHNHDDRYFTETESDARFASITHNHDGRYLLTGASATFASAVHNHDDRYYTESESDARFAAIVHNHDGRYLFVEASATFASAVHIHDDRYFTETESDARFAAIAHNHDGRYLLTGASATFASAVHNHDDRYFTETESDARFAAIVHNHDGRYLFTEASATFASAVHNHDGTYLRLDTGGVVGGEIVAAGSNSLGLGGASYAILAPSGAIAAIRPSTVNGAFVAALTGDTFFRYAVYMDGAILWGDGSSVPDVGLSRYSANVLRLGSDDYLRLQVDPSNDEDATRKSWVDIELQKASNSQYVQSAMQIGSVSGYWRFNENSDNDTFTDISGSEHHGTHYPGTLLEQVGLVASDSDRSAYYSGVSTASAYSIAPTSSAATFTVEMWVQPSTLRLQTLVHSVRGVSFPAASGGWELYQPDTTGSVNFFSYNASGVPNYGPQAPAGSLSTSSPSHIVASYDSATRTKKIYVNGDLSATTILSASGAMGSPRDFIFVATNAISGVPFNGKVDELVHYSKLLSATQVKRRYQDGLRTLGIVEPVQWKTIRTMQGYISASFATGSYFFLQSGGQMIAPGSLLSVPLLRLAAADYGSIDGKVLSLRMVGTCVVNAAAPATSFGMLLYPISTVAGGTNALTATYGAALFNGTDWTTPAANSMANAETGAITFPADDQYVMGIKNATGTTAASTVCAFTVSLQVGWV